MCFRSKLLPLAFLLSDSGLGYIHVNTSEYFFLCIQSESHVGLHEGDLVARLLSGYDVNARPILDPTKQLNINMSLAIREVIGMVSGSRFVISIFL